MNTKIKNLTTFLFMMSITFMMGQHEFKADANSSIVNWKGFKPTGNHYGTVELKSGSFTVKDKKITAGTFDIDMNSIKDLDMDADNEYNAKLVGHLKSDDFFWSKEISYGEF